MNFDRLSRGFTQAKPEMPDAQGIGSMPVMPHNIHGTADSWNPTHVQVFPRIHKLQRTRPFMDALQIRSVSFFSIYGHVVTGTCAGSCVGRVRDQVCPDTPLHYTNCWRGGEKGEAQPGSSVWGLVSGV